MDRAAGPPSHSDLTRDTLSNTPAEGYKLDRGDAQDLQSVLNGARAGIYPEQALLIELSPPDGATEDSGTVPLHHTRAHATTTPSALTLALGLRPDSLVYVLVKTGRNPFSGMITIGRAPNNDLILGDSSVSKFHAYFRAARPDALSLYDVGSTNGTKVDGLPVKVDGVPVVTLNRIQIGEKPFIFIARNDVKAWLAAQIVDVQTGLRPRLR